MRNFHPRRIYPDLIFKSPYQRDNRIRLIKQLYREYKLPPPPPPLIINRNQGAYGSKNLLANCSSRTIIILSFLFINVSFQITIMLCNRLSIYRNITAYLDPSHRLAAVVIHVHVNGDRISVRVDRAIQPRLQPYAAVAQQERLLHSRAGAHVL